MKNRTAPRGRSAAGYVAALLITLFLLATGGGWNALQAQTARKPFPQHVTYVAGTIKPTNVTQDQMDAFVKQLYNNWKGRFLVKACEPNQYYVWFDENPADGGAAANTISVSEGQGYGMIICAYMAGYDTSAKHYFDGLYTFFKANHADSSPYLMGWNQVVGCTNAAGGGASTATDGDLDIAYALLLADKQWGSSGAINYRAEAQNVINAIKQYEVNSQYKNVLIGDWSRYDASSMNSTRTSDFMMDHFKSFGQATGDTVTWNGVVNTCYSITQSIQKNYSAATGLLPDFANSVNSAVQPSLADYTAGGLDGKYSANACRVPWRMGIDYLIHGDQRAYAALTKINTWLRTSTGGDPNKITAGYSLSGTPVNPGWNTVYFTAPFAVGAMINKDNQAWLNGMWTWIQNFDYASEKYYANSLAVLNVLTITGNWWSPSAPENATLGVNDAPPAVAPGSFRLEQNYPNPFNPTTAITYSIGQAEEVALTVYTMAGQEVARLVSGVQSAGSHTVNFDASALASGVYLYTIRTASYTESKRMLLVR